MLLLRLAVASRSYPDVPDVSRDDGWSRPRTAVPLLATAPASGEVPVLPAVVLLFSPASALPLPPDDSFLALFIMDGSCRRRALMNQLEIWSYDSDHQFS